jgi:uncharacterized protein YndB with AHSA1/START domain
LQIASEVARIEDEREIAADADRVWQAIHDPAQHESWHPFASGIAGATRTARSADAP